MRSTFKVLFYVNGSKEKNGIICRMYKFCPHRNNYYGDKFIINISHFIS